MPKIKLKPLPRPCKQYRADVCLGLVYDGFVYCKACRRASTDAALRSRRKHIERTRANGRKYALAYARSSSAKAKAYKKRNKSVRLAATAAWVARNAERRRLLARFEYSVRAGDVVRPEVCDDCGQPPKRKGKLVVWGLEPDLSFECFCCWGCWWLRKRQGEGRA